MGDVIARIDKEAITIAEAITRIDKIEPGVIVYVNSGALPYYPCPHCKRWNAEKPMLDNNLKCPECKRQYTLKELL